MGSSIGFSGKLPRLKFWTLTTSCDISSRMASLLGFKVPISNMEVTKVPQSMVGRTKRDNAEKAQNRVGTSTRSISVYNNDDSDDNYHFHH